MKQNYQEYNIEQKSPQSLFSNSKAEPAKIILIELELKKFYVELLITLKKKSFQLHTLKVEH